MDVLMSALVYESFMITNRNNNLIKHESAFVILEREREMMTTSEITLNINTHIEQFN
jgi:acyl-ACP thioesterase